MKPTPSKTSCSYTSIYVEKNEVRLFCWCLCEGVSRSSHERNMQKNTWQSQRAPQGLACQLPPAPWLTRADSFRHFHPHLLLSSINRNRTCQTSDEHTLSASCGTQARWWYPVYLLCSHNIRKINLTHTQTYQPRFIDRRVVLGAVCPGHYSSD